MLLMPFAFVLFRQSSSGQGAIFGTTALEHAARHAGAGCEAWDCAAWGRGARYRRHARQFRESEAAASQLVNSL